MARKVGYARVSSKDQNLDRQIEALIPFVENKDNIFAEKESGKDMNRDKIQMLKVLLDEGDSLYVVSLDRLGRNKKDIKELLAYFASKHVMVRVLDLPTTLVEAKDDVTAATMEMITNLLVEVLGYVAETERRYIHKRQAEGIAVAKAKGKRLGRIPKALPQTWNEDYKKWKDGTCTAMSLIKKYGWAPATFYSKVREYEENKSSGVMSSQNEYERMIF